MKYIYMNEHISEKDPEDPVIATWDSNNKRVVYANLVEIKDRTGVVIARVKFGHKPPKDIPHQVVAWIEVYDAYLPVSIGY